MNKENKYLIELCKAYINGEKVKLKSDIDYGALYSLSNSHNLSAVAFCVINTAENRDIVPKSALKSFENDFLEAVVRYDIQGKTLGEIDSVLSGGGVKHVFFKGAQLKEYYPIPCARVMSDIDVLIPQSERDRVKALLTENGFENVNSNGPVYDYTKEGVLIEVHTRIISGKVGNSNAEEVFLNALENAQFDGYSGTLDINYHLAYLITHIAHHFWFYGAGIKMIIDLAVIQKSLDIDREKVFEKLDEEGLGEFAKYLFAICYEWFGIGETFDVDTEETAEFLMTYGAFGNRNRNKAAVIERKELEEGKSNSRLLTKLRLLFPSYKKLRNIPYIRFIEGRPYLIVYAWIYRIFYNLKNRRALVKKVNKNIGSDESNSDAEKELAYFKEIGLL